MTMPVGFAQENKRGTDKVQQEIDVHGQMGRELATIIENKLNRNTNTGRKHKYLRIEK